MYSRSANNRITFMIYALCWLCSLRAAPPASDSGVVYRVGWEGISTFDLKDELKRTSRTEELKDAPPPSIPLLRRRMNQDIPRLESLLKAHGYYLATVKTKLDATSEPPMVVFICTPGPLFRFESLTVLYTGTTPPRVKWTPLLNEEDVASTRNILLEGSRLLRFLRENGHPAPQLGEREFEIDPKKRTATIVFHVDPGPAKKFGELKISGLETISEKYIYRQQPWEPNDWFDSEQLEEFEKTLILSGLFSRVYLSLVDPSSASETQDLQITLSERHKRTVKLGADYRSDVGFGTKASWEHRNFLGNGEQFQLDGVVAELEKSVQARIRKPGFRRHNQNIQVNLGLEEEETDAYRSLNLESRLSIGRTINRYRSIRLGLGYKYSTIEQIDEENDYALIFVPLEISWDHTRNALNPIDGHRLYAELTPYTEILDGNLTFGRAQFTGTHYLPLRKQPQLILASRLSTGSLVGAETNDIPADERFHTGGGGAVRGYSYQSIGPQTEQTPTGGSSLMEVSAELRARFTETWGGVLFIDGGMVSPSENPIDTLPLKWGAGIGLRVFTGLGPLRLDLAYPLNPDANQEQRLQFYISLGQAF